MSELTLLERLVRRDRTVTAVGLAVLCLLAWTYLLSGAGLGMDPWRMTTVSLFPYKASPPVMMDMGGMDMAPTAPAWTPLRWVLTAGMWSSMMVAMMAPSAAPAVLLYARVRRQEAARNPGSVAPSGAFLAGYLLAWVGFSLLATTLHWGLERTQLMSSEGLASQSRWLSAGVLAAAGLYQLSPVKALCLTRCRSPAAFISRHWRPGLGGAVRLGALHGAYCVGCCWLLMALLFVGGVMNLAWIAILTLLVIAEKLLPGGRWVGRGAGVALIAWSLATLAV